MWWLRLGIPIERIKPGHPEQNGRHERMHLTLKKEATKPVAETSSSSSLDSIAFLDCFNRERPAPALNMKFPAELYLPSPRPYHGLGELEYPFHDRTIAVTRCGRICFGRRKINLSTSSPARTPAIKQVERQFWLVSFMDYDLGCFDDELPARERPEPLRC